MKHLEDNPRLSHQNYVWYEMSFFTVRSAGGSSTVLCFNTPHHFRVRLFKALSSNSRGFDEPDMYQLHTYLTDQVLNLYDEAIWALRDIVRNVEKVSLCKTQAVAIADTEAKSFL